MKGGIKGKRNAAQEMDGQAQNAKRSSEILVAAS